jgi:hypothetical protein
MNTALKYISTIPNPNVKDGDGDDDGESPFTEKVIIHCVDNGWIVETRYSDKTKDKEVFDVSGYDDGQQQMLEAVFLSLGIENSNKSL